MHGKIGAESESQFFESMVMQLYTRTNNSIKQEGMRDKMRPMPREAGLENGLKVLREGYMYIPNRRKSFHASLFETTLMGQRAVCMGGEEAAKLFLSEEYFIRKGAMPGFVQKTLLGEGGIQSLDDNEHRNRKAAFLRLMARDRVDEWGKLIEKELMTATETWIQKESIVLYEEAQKILTKATCEWAGVPLDEADIDERAEQLILMVESPASPGITHVKGRAARVKAEAWIKELVEQVRKGDLTPPEKTALYTFSWHRNLDGSLLDVKTAAIEVLNILRPSIAISIYLCFTALALHQYPEEKTKLFEGNPYYLHMFIQEIRRYFPFFPFQAARARKEFTWKGHTFKKDTLTLLDIYGTNQDPAIWESPETFNPDRFQDWHSSPTNHVQYQLLAQGGGDYARTHRCPGEWNTVRAMEVFADHLANRITYDLPEQDLSYSMVNMPTRPKSGVVLENVRWK